jgi:hypothetical protein
MLPLITKKEAERILKSGEGSVEVSLDLGISSTSLQIKDGLVHVNEDKVPLKDFEKVKEDACYAIEDDSLKKLAIFSEKTDLYYKLMPTKDWPTIKLSATPMHRYVKVSPKEDTLSKIREIKPVKGKILDTCCGLGYTAIVSSREADEVYTFEKDHNMLYMASLNPYSQELFTNKKIKIFQEDISEAISRFENNFFDRIIHDPPTFKREPTLYSKNFYQQLFRILKKGSILYHYAPWPHKTRREVFYKSMIKNLKECGFRRAEYKPDSSGIRATK